jgi:hypothetical protein
MKTTTIMVSRSTLFTIIDDHSSFSLFFSFSDEERENTTRSPKKSRESLRTPSPYCAAASSSSSSSSASSSAPPVLPTMATLNFGPPGFTRPDLPGSSLALAMVDDEEDGNEEA